MNKSFTLTNKQVETLAKAAGAAPSGGNAQPWLLEIDHNCLTIRLNKKRAGSFLDVGQTASLIGLGCFTQNLILASYHLKFVPALTVHLPNTYSNLNQIATITLEPQSKPHSDNLFTYIHQRATNRKLYNGSIINQSNLKDFQKYSKQFSQNIDFAYIYKNSSKNIAAQILGQADLIRFRHAILAREMMSEFRWSKTEAQTTRDGIELPTLEAPGNLTKMLQLVRDHPSFTHELPDSTLAAFATPLLLNCSHLCTIAYNSSHTPKPIDWFNAGRTLQHIWLSATSLGLAIQPWSILSFFIARVKLFQSQGFSDSEIEIVTKASLQWNKLFSLKPSSLPMFIFRLSQANPPTAVSLKLKWQDYTSIKT